MQNGPTFPPGGPAVKDENQEKEPETVKEEGATNGATAGGEGDRPPPEQIKAPELTDFKDVPDPNVIPFRFIFNNKRKIKTLSPQATFEDLKAAVQEAFPEIQKVKFPVQNMIFQYPTDPSKANAEVSFLENQEQWAAFCDPANGTLKAVKLNRAAIKIVNKKSRKRTRNANESRAGEPPVKRQAIGGPGVMKARKSKPKGPRVQKPVASSVAYQKANFRGALQEYFQRAPDGKGINLQFNTQEKDVAELNPGQKRGQQKCYISTCKVSYQATDYVGMGHAPAKKSSIQFAALDVILKMNLVTPAEHQAAHPPAA